MPPLSVRARRPARLAIALTLTLTLLLSAATAADSAASASSGASVLASASSSAFVSAATPCEICRDTGDCSAAYHDTAGKFCGAYSPPRHYGDSLACCCAKSDTCSSLTSGCYCETPFDWTWAIVFGAALVIAFGVLTMRGRWRRWRHRGDVVYTESTAPYSQPGVYTQGPYVQQGYPQHGAFMQGGYPHQGAFVQGGYSQQGAFVQRGYPQQGYAPSYAPGFTATSYTQGGHGGSLHPNNHGV